MNVLRIEPETTLRKWLHLEMRLPLQHMIPWLEKEFLIILPITLYYYVKVFLNKYLSIKIIFVEMYRLIDMEIWHGHAFS